MKKATGKKPKWSLQYRLKGLLIVSSILPLLIVWAFTNTWVLSLYRTRTQQVIQSELSQIMDNMELLMTSMTYMSQQIATDAEFMTKLRETQSRDHLTRTNANIYLNRRISLYEGTNPNISNLMFFTQEDGRNVPVNSGLVDRLAIDEGVLFSTQHLIRFYGPHPTQSVVSDYPVISLVRKMPVPGLDSMYLYMESGYRKLGVFRAQTLDSIRAIYTVVSDQGDFVFSSNDSAIATGMVVEADADRMRIGGQTHLLYQLQNARGWRLCVFVPQGLFNSYILTLMLGFLLTLLAAILLSILVGGILWRSINRSFRLFTQNLQNVMLDNMEADIRKIHVEEFDQNFAYFETLKQKILSLLHEAQQQEKLKATLKTRQLLYKINPHFIYNTLNTLKWYAVDKGYADIVEFLAAFNRIMMYNMEKDKRTTLESELSSMRDYIALQQLKYELRYTVDIAIPEPMLQTQTPRFMLYPLVENAIMHGLEGKGAIHISISLLENGKISIRIMNSGHPIAKEEAERLMQDIREPDGPGIGLRYVYQILKAQFGEESGFLIHSAESGSEFTIIIPYSIGEYYAKSAID